MRSRLLDSTGELLRRWCDSGERSGLYIKLWGYRSHHHTVVWDAMLLDEPGNGGGGGREKEGSLRIDPGALQPTLKLRRRQRLRRERQTERERWRGVLEAKGKREPSAVSNAALGHIRLMGRTDH